jgi:hypothetical protein
MIPRRVLQAGAMTWAAVGLAVAVSALGSVTPDALAVVAVASVGGPLAAAFAVVALHRHRDRAAGWLLLLSVVTPTYLAWVLNGPALLVGVTLVVVPRIILSSGTSLLESTQTPVGRSETAGLDVQRTQVFLEVDM